MPANSLRSFFCRPSAGCSLQVSCATKRASIAFVIGAETPTSALRIQLSNLSTCGIHSRVSQTLAPAVELMFEALRRPKTQVSAGVMAELLVDQRRSGFGAEE